MSNVFLPITIFGYTLGTMLATVVVVYRSATARRAASFLFVGTWLTHLGAIVQQTLTSGHPAPSNLPEFLLLLGWAILSLHLYLWFRLRVDVAGLVLPPIALLAAFASLQLSPMASQGTVAPGGFWFQFHTSVSTLGLATLCVAFAMSVTYLLQDRALKSQKTLRLLERLPALERSDQIGSQALLLGFVLLSVGIGTGVVINAAEHERLWVLGAKQVFALLAWIVFAAVLLARSGLGFRGTKAAYMTIAGFALGVLTVLGMTL